MVLDNRVSICFSIIQVDSIRVGEYIWGVEKWVNEDKGVEMGLFGQFLFIQVSIVFFQEQYYFESDLFFILFYKNKLALVFILELFVIFFILFFEQY